MQASYGPLIVQIDSVACLKMIGWTLLISLLIDKEIRMGWPWVGHRAKGLSVLNFSLMIRSDTNIGPSNYLNITNMIFKIRPISKEFLIFFQHVVRLLQKPHWYFTKSFYKALL